MLEVVGCWGGWQGMPRGTRIPSLATAVHPVLFPKSCHQQDPQHAQSCECLEVTRMLPRDPKAPSTLKTALFSHLPWCGYAGGYLIPASTLCPRCPKTQPLPQPCGMGEHCTQDTAAWWPRTSSRILLGTDRDMDPGPAGGRGSDMGMERPSSASCSVPLRGT